MLAEVFFMIRNKFYYMYWKLLDKMPEGWQVDKTCGSPKAGYVFITNGKSVLNGQKRALLKQFTPIKIEPLKTTVSKMEIIEKPKTKDDYVFPAKSVNTLARKKFEEHLLKEITFDLMVCEIEGWNKLEYIKELKRLINSINTKPVKKMDKNNSLFDFIGS